MNGDNVTFVKGHYNRDIFAERGNTIDEAIKNMCLVKNVCKADKILTTITKKQEQSIEAEERKIQTMNNKADKALEEFKNGFVDTFNYYLDTIFSPENVVEKINEIALVLEPEIEEHFNRWGMNLTKIYQLISKLIGKENEEVTDWKVYWKNEVDKLIEFAENRPIYIRQYLEENF